MPKAIQAPTVKLLPKLEPKTTYETKGESEHVPTVGLPKHVPSVGLPKEAKEYLHEWFMAHVDNPFPTKVEKEKIIKDLGLHPVHDHRKIDGWFSRQRKKLRDGQKAQPASDTDASAAKANAVMNKGWAPPSCTEVDNFLYNWMSREENLGDYSPCSQTRENMEKESGIESRRIESWFYRLRKRMKKQADNEGVELETLQKVMTGMLVKERMKKEGLLPESDVEDEPEDEPEEEANSNAGGENPFEEEKEDEEVEKSPMAKVSGLDILSDVATYQRKLSPSIVTLAKLLVVGLSNVTASHSTDATVEENGTVVSEESGLACDHFEGSLFSSIIPRRESPSLGDFYQNL